MSNTLVLTGLDGSNPLAFLAALGTLATLNWTNCDDDPRMDWTLESGAWRPRIYAGISTHDKLIARLAASLQESQTSTRQVWGANPKLPYAAQDFRNLSIHLIAEASVTNRLALDLVAALGVDALASKTGDFLDTALRMVRSGDSAGNGMAAYAMWIIDNTTRDHLWQVCTPQEPALDEGRSLRWDPDEHRSRALQWGDPSKEAPLSRRGVNRLALEALPVFATAPVSGRVVTVGFARLPGEKGQAFTWPIWTVPIPLSVVRSLVTLDTLCAAIPNARALAARGVAVVFRCVRFASSKYYSNLTPSQPV